MCRAKIHINYKVQTVKHYTCLPLWPSVKVDFCVIHHLILGTIWPHCKTGIFNYKRNRSRYSHGSLLCFVLFYTVVYSPKIQFHRSLLTKNFPPILSCCYLLPHYLPGEGKKTQLCKNKKCKGKTDAEKESKPTGMSVCALRNKVKEGRIPF